MEPILTAGAVTVYDNLLPPSLFEKMWQYVNDAPYARSDAQRWQKIWSLEDGAILQSAQWDAEAPDWNVHFSKHNSKARERLRDKPGPPVLGEFVSHLLKVLRSGKGFPSFNNLVMTAHVYPTKSSINWHMDGDGGYGAPDESNVGTFTYYVHKRWNAEWGGEFLLSELDKPYPYNPFDNSELSDGIVSHGHGVWISPKPNRIIVNTSDRYHKVSKTTENAAPRLSIQGFIFNFPDNNNA